MWQELKENNNYEINDIGQVRNKKTKKVLNYWKSSNGYLQVSLFNKGKQKTYYVHRLVANNFIENKCNYKEINHIDCNKENNSIENLEWCDRKHNMKEVYRNNLRKLVYGKDHPSSKKIKQIDLKTGEITIWNSMMDAFREKGYSTGAICDACKGRIKDYKKSKWEYV